MKQVNIVFNFYQLTYKVRKTERGCVWTLSSLSCRNTIQEGV